MNMLSLAAAMLAASPDTPALESAGATWSHADMARAAAQWAGGLARLGIAPGAAVAWRGNALALAQATLACAWRGAVLLPLSPDWPEVRASALIAQCGCEHEHAGTPPEGDALAPVPVTAETLALIVATSGSEGKPKGVMLPERALAAQAASAAFLDLHAGSCWLHCLPLHHVGGQAILHRCWRVGATVRLLDGFEVARVAAALDGATHISLVPAQLARLMAADARPSASLRVALVGGGPLSRPLFERARAAGWPLCPTYGMSETAAQLATALRPGADAWHEGMVGRPLPGMRARVGADDRLIIGGPQLMLGYANPEHTPGDGLVDGEFICADRARIAPDGGLTLRGRADDMLVSGGVNIDPAEVERMLAACPGVRDVAVVGVPDPTWGEIAVALVVGAVAVADVEAWCRNHVPAALRPRRFRHVDALPRNDMGKLARAALRELATA